MREFSTNNTVKPDKSIKTMNYQEYYEYAYRKISEEIRLCNIRMDECRKRLNELVEEKKRFDNCDKSLITAKNMNNLTYIMTTIVPDRNVYEEIKNTTYYLKYETEKKSTDKFLQQTKTAIHQVDNEAAKIKEDLDYWEKELRLYSSASEENMNKKIYYSFWHEFFDIFRCIMGLMWGLFTLSCSCIIPGKCLESKCLISIGEFFAFFIGGCLSDFMPSATFAPIIITFLFYVVIAAICTAIYCSKHNSKIDRRFF